MPQCDLLLDCTPILRMYNITHVEAIELLHMYRVDATYVW